MSVVQYPTTIGLNNLLVDNIASQTLSGIITFFNSVVFNNPVTFISAIFTNLFVTNNLSVNNIIPNSGTSVTINGTFVSDTAQPGNRLIGGPILLGSTITPPANSTEAMLLFKNLIGPNPNSPVGCMSMYSNTSQLFYKNPTGQTFRWYAFDTFHMDWDSNGTDTTINTQSVWTKINPVQAVIRGYSWSQDFNNDYSYHLTGTRGMQIDCSMGVRTVLGGFANVAVVLNGTFAGNGDYVSGTIYRGLSALMGANSTAILTINQYFDVQVGSSIQFVIQNSNNANPFLIADFNCNIRASQIGTEF